MPDFSPMSRECEPALLNVKPRISSEIKIDFDCCLFFMFVAQNRAVLIWSRFILLMTCTFDAFFSSFGLRSVKLRLVREVWTEDRLWNILGSLSGRKQKRETWVGRSSSEDKLMGCSWKFVRVLRRYTYYQLSPIKRKADKGAANGRWTLEYSI